MTTASPTPGVRRRKLLMRLVRDGLADLVIADGRRTILRLDRVGFAFPDGATALVHWYPIRGGRRPGDLELIVGAMLGGGGLGARVAERTGVPGGTATGWVVSSGSLNGGPGGSSLHYEITTDEDVAPVAATIVADVREVHAPMLALARLDPSAAADRVESAPWLAAGRAAELAAALREEAAALREVAAQR
ncbi:MAG: hypothetical protein WCK58_11440 [Chloroflexota bacterium]